MKMGSSVLMRPPAGKVECAVRVLSTWLVSMGERKRNFTGQHFWARGYFISMVGRDEAVIREYIRKQRTAPRSTEYVALMATFR